MKPKFPRQHISYKKRVKKKWRKPRGIDSEQRRGIRARGAKPSIGYGSPRKERGMHPSGYFPVLVRNLKDLEKLGEKHVIRIARVGKKKKALILAKCMEKKLRVLNA